MCFFVCFERVCLSFRLQCSLGRFSVFMLRLGLSLVVSLFLLCFVCLCVCVVRVVVFVAVGVCVLLVCVFMCVSVCSVFVSFVCVFSHLCYVLCVALSVVCS